MLLCNVAEGWVPLARLTLLVATMAGYAWLGWTEYRQIQLRDELRRRLEMEAMALAFIGAGGVLMLLFFMRVSKLAAVPFDAAPASMAGCYLLSQFWARLRYRYWAL